MKISNSLGLNFYFLENGLVKSIEANPIRISLKKASLFSKSVTNIYLRNRAVPYDFIPIIGPESNSQFYLEKDKYIAKGKWNNIEYQCVLKLSNKSLSWQWSVSIANKSSNIVELDIFYVQDVGLKTQSDGLVNEYYVSQYIERLTLEDQKYGKVVCCRQNMRESNGHPWLLVACNAGALAASTDGMQFFGKTFRATGVPESLLSHTLDGEYAGESSVIALQSDPIVLFSNQKKQISFVVKYLADHSSATSAEDLKLLPDLMTEFEEDKPASQQFEGKHPIRNIFNTSPLLPAEELSEEELSNFFGKGRTHIETQNQEILSFYSDDKYHIVLKAKELLADRPHGHIMQAKTGLVPNESIMSTNTFAYGVFNSHLTQGNTNFNIFLSVCSSQFNTAVETGQRIFVKIDGKSYLLGVPSVYEIGLNHTRWIYKFKDYIFQVRTWTSKAAHQINLDFKVIKGSSVNIIITNHFDEANGWQVSGGLSERDFIAKPKANSIIASKYPNAQFRIFVQDPTAEFKISKENEISNSLFALDVINTSTFCISFLGEVCNPSKPIEIENSDEQWLNDCNDARKEWENLSLNLSLLGNQKDVAAINNIIPWFGMNALTHYLTPYGLEQFGGAAWGTRDVSQGPIDLLLSLEKFDEAKQVLRIIFSNQNPDGGWPQWWMFDSYRNIRAHEAHGDIFYWCIIALSNYIKATGDLKILDEELPFYSENPSTEVEKTPLSEHIDRLIKTIVDSFIPGTCLVPFGGGDWNDSLQPVSEELAQRMISSWTVEMNYQAFSQYQKVYELSGNWEKANELKIICSRIKADFNKHLIRDGVVAGYGLVEKDKSISVLLHPSDKTTGIHYSALPMNRGIISGIFTKEQAQHHQELVEKHLKGPDGVRLMDRPLKYQGGIQKNFQRAESSTFFGREIGLMYIHEHIRYAESLAIMGKAEGFMKALRQAIPIDYNDIVPFADIRQSNCYYSSSDVVFKSRYDADERYEQVIEGKLTVRGGWRVYSSGPGIYIGIIISRLLGLRVEFGNVIFDPVMPKSLKTLKAQFKFYGKYIEFEYRVNDREYGPKSISINGHYISFEIEANSYRQGGAQILKKTFLEHLQNEKNKVIINL